jgi:Carboxypeptidase regulatory-like domain/TonB dependent receptor
MGTPLGAPETASVIGARLVLAAFFVCSSGVAAGVAVAQPNSSDDAQQPASFVTKIAAATTGTISGVVLDERGHPLNGVVVSAMGGSTSFAVSDRVGQYTLRALTPGAYLVRAHLEGYLPARNTIVTVRPSGRTVSSFTLRREGRAGAARVTTAGAGVTEISAASGGEERDESETAWRLRHLKRSILKDTSGLAAIAAEDEFFLTDSLQMIGRAVESAGALFVHSPLQGQVNLLTTGMFDSPSQLFELQRTRGVAFFSLGAPVRDHGDWVVKAALNQGDLSSWILAGNYVTRDPAQHRYQFGMSFGAHRYEVSSAATLATMPEPARNVGSVYAYDEWRIVERLTIGYGANYAHYDYLAEPAHFSPRISVAYQHPEDRTRIRGVAARHVVAPGAEEFLPPSRADVLPPQRTFAPLTRTGFVPEDMRHYEVAVEQLMDVGSLGVRAFYQAIDDQLITVFGLSSTESGSVPFGHYSVGSGGDVDVVGLGITYTHELLDRVRGSIDYSLGISDWANNPSRDRIRLARNVPGALRDDGESIHDVTTTLETEFPESATRVFFLYKVNSAYTKADLERPGLDARWDVQVSQGLPFMRFTNAEWEMLVGVRNLFREAFTETSVYDELLVSRPPKRVVGGITVKF